MCLSEMYQDTECSPAFTQPGSAIMQLRDALPSLRRYAACLVNSVTSGDELIDDFLRGGLRGDFDMTALTSRTAVFREFQTRVMNRIWAPLECGDHRTGPIFMLLLVLPFHQRCIVMLSETLGFTSDEIARIVPFADNGEAGFIEGVLAGALQRLHDDWPLMNTVAA